MPTNKRPMEERFWAKVQKTETCWLWTGYISKSGSHERDGSSIAEGLANPWRRLRGLWVAANLPMTLFDRELACRRG